LVVLLVDEDSRALRSHRARVLLSMGQCRADLTESNIVDLVVDRRMNSR